MRTAVTTGGETLAINCDPDWVRRLIDEAIHGEPMASGASAISVSVESAQKAFGIANSERLARNAWRQGSDVVMENVLGTGFDALVRAHDGTAEFIYRWRPGQRERVAARVLRSRFILLARAALIQYPALWWAVVRGRAPLHASGIDLGRTRALVCGPGGVGKSTLMFREIQDGGKATDDNMSVSDGKRIWGVVEPIRVTGGGGRRMPFGRSERPFPDRIPEIMPEKIVVLRHADAAAPMTARPIDHALATRALVGGTYMAGELRRFWSFAAGLSLGTDLGPPHPPVTAIAERLSKRLPCFEVSISRAGIVPLADLIENGTGTLREVSS